MDFVSRAAQRWRELQPGLDVRPMLVVGRIQRLGDLWDARLRSTFAAADLQSGDFDVLAALRRADAPVAPGDLARGMLVTAGATTKRVDRLVAASLAERLAASGDRRHRLVQLTPGGVALADELMTKHLRAEAQLIATLTVAEQRQLEALLAKLLDAADRRGPEIQSAPPSTADETPLQIQPLRSTMPNPNLFIVYVTDIAASTAFYSELFDITPRFTSPRFVEFEVAPGVGLALWSGHECDLSEGVRRTSEVCLNLPGGPEAIDEQYARWRELDVAILKPPHDDVFGRTFVARDPDGNLLRVAPIDPA